MKVHQHDGISLPVVLALLLGMALFGAAILQSGVLYTRMTVELQARNRAFQAAEGALRMGEQLAGHGALPTGDGCVGGLCGMPSPDAPERWREPGSSGWQEVAGEQSIGLPAARFMVEYLGQAPSTPGCERVQPMAVTCLRPLYRITARSAGEHGAMLLQSHYLDARVSWREMIPLEYD